MKTVLIDASSAILLFKAGLFDKLTTNYHVLMAPSVFDEITVSGYPGDQYFTSKHQMGMFRISPCPQSLNTTLDTLSSLGKGEADTLRLYSVYPHAFVIIDDGKGARFCRNQKIPYINALLVPKILYFAGCITGQESREAMDSLYRLGRYSPRILAFAQICSRHGLAYFQIERDHDTSQHIPGRQCMEK